jgi:ankyrin repeat protein
MHCLRNNLTALHFAAHQNLTEIGLLLLQNSANPLAKDMKYVLV